MVWCRWIPSQELDTADEGLKAYFLYSLLTQEENIGWSWKKMLVLCDISISEFKHLKGS